MGRRGRAHVLTALNALLLGVNAVKYALPPLLGRGCSIPVEFSSVAYFTTPAIVIMYEENSRARCWAAYSALMAGFFYYLAMSLAGEVIYGEEPPLEMHVSMLCHGLLLLTGMTLLLTERYASDCWPLLAVGTASVAAWALLLRPVADRGGRLLIYLLLDARPAEGLLPERAVPLWYVAVAVLLLCSEGLFMAINRAAARKFE